MDGSRYFKFGIMRQSDNCIHHRILWDGQFRSTGYMACKAFIAVVIQASMSKVSSKSGVILLYVQHIYIDLKLWRILLKGISRYVQHIYIWNMLTHIYFKYLVMIFCYYFYLILIFLFDISMWNTYIWNMLKHCGSMRQCATHIYLKYVEAKWNTYIYIWNMLKRCGSMWNIYFKYVVIWNT